MWRILAYPEIVDLNPSGSFDSSRIISSGVDMKEAMTAAVTPKGFAAVYPVYPAKTVQISLNGSSVLFEPGAMHFMKGNLEMSLDTTRRCWGIGGFFKRAATSIASGESMLKPRVTGSGDVFLSRHGKTFFLIHLQNLLSVIGDFGAHVMVI